MDDEESHEIQNEIDQVMDKIDTAINDETFRIPILFDIRKKLEEIRDSIPCSCGDDD